MRASRRQKPRDVAQLAPAAAQSRIVRVAEPVVVLSYAWSGIGLLRTVMEAHPDIAWIAGVNLVQLCDQLATAWHIVEGLPDSISSLAHKSIRMLLHTMLIPRLAAKGETRWISVALGTPRAADSFAQLYPHAKFICLHRDCADVIQAGVLASPWGLASYGLGSLAASYPGNSVGALAEYWTENTEGALLFEREHPGQCMRVRYEDLVSEPTTTARNICAFIGLADTLDLPAGMGMGAPVNGVTAVGSGKQVPFENVPGHLLATIGELLADLGYPAIDLGSRHGGVRDS